MTAGRVRRWRRRRVSPQLLVVIAVALALVLALQRLGSRFGPPPVDSWAALTRWYDQAPPEVAAVAVLRPVAQALAGWLLVASVLQALVALPGLGSVGRLADLISPRALQRLGHGLAGLSLTAGLAAVAPGAGTPAAFARTVATASTPGDHDSDRAEDEQGTASIRLVGDAAPTTALTESSPPSRSREVTVEPGDSFWSIAADELAARGGAPPSERLIVPYWRRLIEQNRRELVDPGNPDLLYPGQVVTLPPA